MSVQPHPSWTDCCSKPDTRADKLRRRTAVRPLCQAQHPGQLHGRRAEKGKVSPRCARWRPDAWRGRTLPVHARQPSHTSSKPGPTGNVHGCTGQPLHPGPLRNLLPTTLCSNTYAPKPGRPGIQPSALSNISRVQPGASSGCERPQLLVARPAKSDAAIWTALRPKRSSPVQL
jgi:hypothetical protein